jgi:hypothetical protein
LYAILAKYILFYQSIKTQQSTVLPLQCTKETTNFEIGLMSNSKMIGKAIASGICFGILASFNASQGPASAAAPIIAETAAPAATNLDKQLLGQWQGTIASGQSFTFLFAPKGKLFFIAKRSDGETRANEMRYKINLGAKPMHLDVTLSSTETVETVFELTPEGQMRLQLEGTNPGLPRPNSLNEQATVLKKVSETTALPPNIPVIRY